MRALRGELRRAEGVSLSEPQLRALAHLRRRPDGTLSAVAEQLGLGLASASKLVDGLVRHGYVESRRAREDRRRVRLALTEPGEQALEVAFQHLRGRLRDDLEVLAPESLATVSEAMRLLREVYEGRH